MSKLFSTKKELKEIANILSGYLKLNIGDNIIPGSIMENTISSVRKAEVLKTYDFVDVICEERKIGWQVKSSKEKTALTWKRVKLPDSAKAIQDSKSSKKELQRLGDMIIDYCNKNAFDCFEKYSIDELGFSRLIMNKDGSLTYYERILCSKDSPMIFKKEDFIWKWSHQRKQNKKESLPGLNGINIHTGEKWFAWYGLGENQLHFYGEKTWRPELESNENTIKFKAPKDKMSSKELMKLLKSL